MIEPLIVGSWLYENTLRVHRANERSKEDPKGECIATKLMVWPGITCLTAQSRLSRGRVLRKSSDLLSIFLQAAEFSWLDMIRFAIFTFDRLVNFLPMDRNIVWGFDT